MQTKTILFAFLSLMGVASASPVGDDGPSLNGLSKTKPQEASPVGDDGPSNGTSQIEPQEIVKRTASVSVRNNTPNPITEVSVIHKYSDNYKNQHQWGKIPAYQLARESFKVEYHTGPFTTGRDWWLLAFYNEDMEMLYYTDPDNLRSFVDAMEGLAPGVIEAISSAGAGMATSSVGAAEAVVAAAAAAAAAKLTTDSLFNSEGTAGFKQHILRAEDANQLTEIIINSDYTVTFRSKSGHSETKTTKRRAPGQ